MQLYLPHNLDLKLLLTTSPPPFKYHVDNFNYIISTIVKLKSLSKDYIEYDYVPLSSKSLQSKIREYKLYLDYLIEHDVLEVENNGWYSDGRARRYRLAGAYRTNEIDIVEIDKFTLDKALKAEATTGKKKVSGYGYLTKWFNPSLRLNLEYADARLLNLVIQERDRIGFDAAMERYQYRLLSAKLFDSGLYNLHVDENIRRFHSNLTNLKKELRTCLTYNGERLWEIDLKNSQPFFSMVLLNPEFYEKKKHILTLYDLSKDIYQRIQPKLSTIQTLLSSSPFITLVKSDESEASSDIQLYCTLVDKGRLYQYFSLHYEKLTGTKLDMQNADDKRMVKEGVFYSLYAPNYAYRKQYADFKRLFKRLFPTVFEIFSLLRNAAYKDLARILQLIESELMIRRSAQVIGQNHPDLPIFTIHDSIATIQDGKDIVYDTVKEQCLNLVGLQPSLSVEEWR